MKWKGFGVLTLILLIVLATGCPGLFDQQPLLTEGEVETIAQEFALAIGYTLAQEEMPSGITGDENNLTFTNYTLPSTYDSEAAASPYGKIPTYIGSGSVFNGTMTQTESDTTMSVDMEMRVSDPEIPGEEATVEVEVAGNRDIPFHLDAHQWNRIG